MGQPFGPAGSGHGSIVGESQMRVTYDFSGAREVHYVSAVPEVGDYVTHLRELWVVRKVEENGVGPLVICEPPRPESGGSVN